MSLNSKTIAVVVPAYNEGKLIGNVIDSMPDFVDRIIVVNDASTDNTEQVIREYIDEAGKSDVNIRRWNGKPEPNRYNRAEILLYEQNDKELDKFPPSEAINTDPTSERIILINIKKNSGVGAAIARGYKWAKDHAIDCTAVMAGDSQMDPAELEKICLPVVNDNVDYVKGNRLIHRSAWLVVPKVRYIGNSILSILNKIASGYWHVSDTQTGYTAISLEGLRAIRIHDIYKRYGMPNDMLVKLNIAFCTVSEVPIKPVYNIGEESKMKVLSVIPRISWLLFRSFFKRLWIKYFFRDFHPLFILYNFAIILGILCIPCIYCILHCWWFGDGISVKVFIAFLFLFISGFQSFLFAMWMDIQDNERLYK
ncbi:glycosyltransferase family 2 protein [bacterium]|nr:glycosyltransferase family 2 protein [bacterium]